MMNSINHIWSHVFIIISLVVHTTEASQPTEKPKKQLPLGGTDICELVTTFDAVCKLNNNIIILSAHPCNASTALSIAVIDFKNGRNNKYIQLDGDSKEAIPIWNDGSRGIKVVQFVKPGRDVWMKEDYRFSRLHVILYLVDIVDRNDARKDKDMFLEVLFPMLTPDCSFVYFAPQTFFSSVCDHHQSLGNFSSFCIIERGVSAQDKRIEAGVYILMADICTTPYSISVLALSFDTGKMVKRTFTQDKTDTYFFLEPSLCGLALRMEEHFGMHLRVKLLYGCGGENSTLLDSVFQTQSGMICPLSTCKPDPNDMLRKLCVVPWISGRDEVTHAHIQVRVDLCKPTRDIWWDYSLPDVHKKQVFQFEKQQVLEAGKRYPFHLGYPSSMHNAVSTNNGYLYLDWGDVSLFTRGTDVLYVTVFRHYPHPNNSIPLFRTQFWLGYPELLEAAQNCPKPDLSLRTGLPIAGVGLLVLVLVIIWLYVRYLRRRRRGEVGGSPPYAIHLGEMDDMEEQE